jgi:ABC-type multidrug transport system fused ATPase/permease subunit
VASLPPRVFSRALDFPPFPINFCFLFLVRAIEGVSRIFGVLMTLVALVRRLMFSDVKSLVSLARRKVLQAEDMPPLPRWLSPRAVPFSETSLDISNGKSLLYSMAKYSRNFLVPALSLNLIYGLLNLTKPVLVNSFIKEISGDLGRADAFTYAIVLALSLGVVSFIGSLSLQHYFHIMLQTGQIYTNALNRLIYRKSLMLSQKSRAETQVGDVVNHMSSDTEYSSELAALIGDSLITAITIVGSVVLLFWYLGFTAIAALVLLGLMVPLSKKVGKSFASLDHELMGHRDARVTLMGQVLNGIRVVKYFAWEKSVKKEVEVVREAELAARRRMARAEALATLSYAAISTIVLFVTLGVHIQRGFTLSPELVFTCVAIFGLLEEPLGHLSELISRSASALVGANRISQFLQRESLPAALHEEKADAALAGFSVENLSLRFNADAPLTLSGLDFRVLPGESVAIVGSVGSGKSTLIQCLLGELPLASGAIRYTDLRSKSVVPRLAYVPQEAFIVNGSMEENIYFGGKPNPERLAEALHASCLDADLPLLPAGLFTEIGEKGVNLSGGQKQRVSLARAAMHAPTVALLDDPLSAVDHRTESQLAERLLFGLWRNITRVVVTHRLAYLGRFDKVVFLKEGRMEGVGTLDELLKIPSFQAYYANFAQSEDTAGIAPNKEAAPAKASEASPLAASRVTEDEDRAIGAVKSTVYFDYVRALGGSTFGKQLWMIPFLFASSIAAASLPLLQRAWLAYSSNLQSGKEVALHWWSQWASHNQSSILIYGALGVVSLAGVLVNRLAWVDRGMDAGRRFHERMLDSVLKAPLRFFDATPVGRVLQRFSRDVESVDIQLQWSFETTVRCLVNIGVALFLIVGVLPVMLLAVVPVFCAYYFLQRDYRIPAREVKRLDSISRSPRFAHFKETLHGMVVIRSFGRTETFYEGFLDRLEHNQRMFYGHFMLNRWFSSRIPLLGGLVASSTGIAIVLAARAGHLSPGIAGLVIIYALSLWESLNWAVRIFAEVEARMTSVERLKFYGSLESERTTALSPALPPSVQWPERGEVVFDRVVARYASHLPPVLKGISFRVPAGARVGIIGRTGSGKSTLLQALFRCMEVESGAIRIDGVDIASVPLERLRRSLAIIPQDPTLFFGTLRSNLDRYEEYEDGEVLAALDKARLGDFVRALPGGLRAEVKENGANLSQGQRQLLCLARALLSDAKVIVMDEATASVDVHTDSLVQKVVRENCQNITMLIIAHRLGTVADCDLILEVKEGKLHRTLDLKKQEALAPTV